MNRAFRRALPVALAVVLFACLFLFIYQFDNKYTARSPQAVNGVLALDASALERYPVLHLVSGWELFRGKLLSPEDFAQNPTLPGEIIYIGQYAGFERGPGDASAHGTGTYRLNIALPPEPRNYLLELPEIYSAYRLYINGELYEQLGDPDPGSYRPRTGNGFAAVRAAGRLEIILAVSDYSHFYSGLVYPPAFGGQEAVSRLLDSRFALRLLVCAVAAFIGLFYLTTGLRMGNDRPALLYGLLCLCFVGYTCYPVVKTLFRGGMGWYTFENFCYCAMLLLVVLLQNRVSNIGGKAARVSAYACGFVCLCSLLMPFAGGNLALLSAYSRLIAVYGAACAAYLTGAAAYGAHRRTIYSRTMLAGVLGFDTALVANALLPNFEPILSGWFVEWAGGVLAVLTGVVMAHELVQRYRDSLVLEGRIQTVSRLVELQRAHYPVILESVQEARAARHDLRHHLSLIRQLSVAGDTAGIAAYLEAYRADRPAARTELFCDNYVVDTLLRHFAALSEQGHVRFEALADVPDAIAVDDADLAALLSNLLENALEACARLPEGARFVRITIRLIRGMLGVDVVNSFDGIAPRRGERLLSRKRGGGVGIASMRRIADRYGGRAMFTPDAANGVFHSEVALHLCTEQELKP